MSFCPQGGSGPGGVPPNFRGLQFFGGGVPPIFRGGSSKFSGGMGGGSPPEYSQRSAGTHPTGMHSCFLSKFNYYIEMLGA